MRKDASKMVKKLAEKKIDGESSIFSFIFENFCARMPHFWENSEFVEPDLAHLMTPSDSVKCVSILNYRAWKLRPYGFWWSQSQGFDLKFWWSQFPGFDLVFSPALPLPSMQGLLLLGNAKETSFFSAPENFFYGESPLVSDKDSENAQGCLVFEI